MDRMTTSEALVETLVAEGVKVVFGIVGSAYMDLLDLFPAAGIRFVSVAHEQAAAHAADGLARVTGSPQVCVAQNGPGVANFVSAVTAAFWAHSPVVVISPETGSMGIGTGGFQELDQMSWFSANTRFQVRVNRPERMAELARKCFFIAKNEYGPVQLNIPRDYFYGELECEIYPSTRISDGPGSPGEIREAARMLQEARFPVILAGGGVSMAEALEEVRDLADFMTIPVVNSYLHNDSFPYEHPLGLGPLGYCGSKAAMRIISRADLVLALGCRLGPFGTLPQYGMDYWPEKARIIQIDRDHRQLGQSKKVELGIKADVKLFLKELLKVLQRDSYSAKVDEDRLKQVREEKERWERELEQLSRHTGEKMHPRDFLKELSSVIPENAIVTTDVGNTCSMSNSYLKFRRNRQFLAALSWGNCGIAYGLAIGAYFGSPERPVFALQGDGAWGISGLSEVMTAVREEIPVIAVIFNNNEWGAEKKNQIDYYNRRFVGTNLRNPDFSRIATDMGAVGFRVERVSEIREVVQEALKIKRPVVINAIIDGADDVLAEPFRRDALKKARRILPKYKHLNVD